MKRLYILNIQEKLSDSIEVVNPNDEHIMIFTLGEHNLMLRVNGAYVMVDDIYLGKHGTCIEGYSKNVSAISMDRKINEFNKYFDTDYTYENMIRINDLSEMMQEPVKPVNP